MCMRESERVRDREREREKKKKKKKNKEGKINTEFDQKKPRIDH